MPSLIARKFLLTKPDYNNELVEKEIEKMSEKKLKKYMLNLDYILVRRNKHYVFAHLDTNRKITVSKSPSCGEKRFVSDIMKCVKRNEIYARENRVC